MTKVALWILALLSLIVSFNSSARQLTAQGHPQAERVAISGTGRYTTAAVWLSSDKIAVGAQSGVWLYGKTTHLLETSHSVTALAANNHWLVAGVESSGFIVWALDGDQAAIANNLQFTPQQIVFLSSDIIAVHNRELLSIQLWWLRPDGVYWLRELEIGAPHYIHAEGLLIAEAQQLRFCDWLLENCRQMNTSFDFVSLDPEKIAIEGDRIVIEQWLWQAESFAQYTTDQISGVAMLDGHELLVFPQTNTIDGRTSFYTVDLATNTISRHFEAVAPFARVSSYGDLFAVTTDTELTLWDTTGVQREINGRFYSSSYLTMGGQWLGGGRFTPFMLFQNTGQDLNFTGATERLLISPDGQTLLRQPTADLNSVEVWQLAFGEAPIYLTTFHHNGPITGLSFSGDSQYLATNVAGTVRLWHIPALRSQTYVYVGPHVQDAIALNQDGTMLVTGGSDNDFIVEVWDIQSSRVVETHNFHTQPVNKLLFTDGMVISSDVGGTIRTLDVATGQSHAIFIDKLVDLAVNKQHLVAATGQGIVMLYSLHDPVQPLLSFESNQGHISAIAFHEDNLSIISDQNGTLWHWRIRP